MRVLVVFDWVTPMLLVSTAVFSRLFGGCARSRWARW
jgi:hypothetical protein